MKSIYERLKKKAVLSTLIVHLSLMSFSATYYVSNNGNDSNSGLSSDQAWKSLSKVNAATFKAGDQVLFERGGVFYGNLTIKNSGAAGSPITFGAYGSGSNPVISGFKSVDSWTNIGNNIWETTDVVTSLSTLNMVVIGGSNTPMGRYPNSGYLTFQSHSGKTSITSTSLSGFNWTGAEAVIRATRWNLYRATITSQSGTTISFSLSGNEPSNNFGFFIQNDPKTLDAQNEWYFNPSTKKLQIYSSSQPKAVQVTTVDNLVVVNGAYVTLTNLNIAGANSHGIYNTSPYTKTNLTIQNCNVQNSGINGIYVVSSPLLIENCTIQDSNNNGIDLSAWVPNATIRGCTVKNSGVIPGISKNDDGSSVGINSKNSSNSNLLVEYCRVVNSGYHGISFYGDQNIIRNNYVDYFCSVKDDGAGIYTWGGSRSKITIQNNIVMNGVGAPAGTTYTFKNLAEGIYLDDNSTNAEVTGNTVSACGDGGIFLHNVNNSVVKNNTLYSNYKQLYTADDGLGGKIYGNTITNNILVAKSTAQKVGFFYANTNDANSQSVSQMGTVDYNYYARPLSETQTMVTLNPDYSEVPRTFEGWKTYSGLDANSKKSPQTVASENDLFFRYNASQSILTVTLPNPMIDMTGKKYSGSLTLAPYTSVVLMKDNNPVVLVPVYFTEYKSICDGSSYNGWTSTGKYDRTLISKSGADSIVTTYLTVNPKYSVTENITINEGESYKTWTKTGQYTRTLSSVSGCDSIVVTNLTVNADTKEGQIVPTHYIPVWQGTGQNLMNFSITSAIVEDIPLDVNDEIAVFSGSLCVGSGKLVQAISSGNAASYLTFKASQNTGSNNGYTLNDTIIFKIWDDSRQQEIVVKKVNYQQTGSSIVSGRYTALATVVASIESYTEYTQTISLKAGNNLISSYVTPSNANMLVVMKPLCDNGALYKMQDESGRSLEYWGRYGGWVNKIGDFTSTEGYNVNVKFDCTLQITGRRVILPLTVSLKKGWNYVSFPLTESVNALSVLQSLIDQNKLYKVQDETGKSIEYLKGYGWVNNIGNFQSGKGYKVYVTASTSLSIQPTYTKGAVIIANTEATEHFIPQYEGNGIAHMNINIEGLTASGLSVGDEIAAFDGDICVGALKLTSDNFNTGVAGLVSSFSTDDQNQNGFFDGDSIVLKAWSMSAGEQNLSLEVIDGYPVYMKNGSVLIGVNAVSSTTATVQIQEVSVSVFPNPTQGSFAVKLGENTDSNSHIEIFDIAGRLVVARQVSEVQEQFNLSGQIPGLYLVKTTIGNKTTVNKLVLSR